jgi:amino acid adenylation domain-containing protein
MNLNNRTTSKEPVAIIGIGCRFPGKAGNPEAFWRLLDAGVDAITEVPPTRWNAKRFFDPEAGKPGKTPARWGGFVEGIDEFDPHFFGISPREATRMDPQQRLLLEVAWEAIEDAGVPLERIAGTRTAVFAGISAWDYSLLQTNFRDRGSIDVYSNTGSSLSIATNRISYCFDFKGPSATVDTACSSALVAVHLACRSIWVDGCPMALAGGVNTAIMPDWFIGFSRLGMLSPDGRCKAFDARANGYVRAEGAGLILLKPLARALADGDRVYATIRGTAVNQDGRTPGMTVPSQASQEELFRLACLDAGVSPAAIGYAEAHGTGTPVGDPIEARALGTVLSEGRPPNRPCLVGSVKTNIGHLEAGSGIAGLIKTALVLVHRRIPANLHFEEPNPEIDFEALKLRVPVVAEPWPDGDGPAIAVVNSFGYGGTNANVVLQEAPVAKETARLDGRVSGEWLVVSGEYGAAANTAASDGQATSLGIAVAPSCVPVVLSARSPEALRAKAAAMHAALTGALPGATPGDLTNHQSPITNHHPAEATRGHVTTDHSPLPAHHPAEATLADIAASAALRRTHHDHRLAIIARSKEDLGVQLGAVAAGNETPWAVSGRSTVGKVPNLAFVCAGQGPQWWAMGRELLGEEQVFRGVIERCDEIIRTLGPWSLLEELTADEACSRMEVTAISQPAIFALQVGLAALWRSWGIRPQALCGHSVGEVAAAHLAGVFDLEDAVRVIFERGRCMELAPARGRMLAAGFTSEEARNLVAPYGDRVALAAVNGPASVTLSGEAEPLEEIARSLEARQIFHRFLQVQYAFHSSQMDPIRRELLASLRGIRPMRSMLPLFSTVTGQRVIGPELGPEYWWQNVRQTVRFVDGIDGLIHLGSDAVLELSPHPVLLSSVAECYQHRGRDVHVLASLRRREPERGTLLRSLGRLHTLGQPIDWRGVLPGRHRFVRLPSYPWQRQICWYESEDSRMTRLTAPAHPLLGTRFQGPRSAWESRLDLKLIPSLLDHRVQRAPIVPAAAFVEVALAVSREALGLEAGQAAELRLQSACFPTADRAFRLHTVYHREDSSVQVFSRPVDSEEDWALHATATLRSEPPRAPETSIDLNAIRGRCSREFSGKACYDYFQKLGLGYGPLYRGIERAWQGESEALGLVVLPEGLEEEAADFLFHPALLDSCFQVGIPANPEFDTVVGGLYLPIEIEQVKLYRRPGRRVWSHARLVVTTAKTSVASFAIYDEDGGLIAEIRGLRTQRVAGSDADSRLDDLAFAFEWQPQPLVAGQEVTSLSQAKQPGIAGPWLVLADRGGIGAAVADRLREAGEDVVLAPASDDPAHLDDLLLRLTTPDRPAIRGIVHLGCCEAPHSDGLSTSDLEAWQDGPLLNVLHLVQAWDRAGSDRSSRLILVTRGAQPCGDTPGPIAVAQAAVIGLGRVIVSEYPRLRTKLVDLDPCPEDCCLEPLLDEIRAEDGEEEIALRSTGRFVARIMPAQHTPSGAQSDHQEAAYRLETSRPGSLDALTLRGLLRRPPGPGEVEIEVRAAALNFSDVMKALGIYPGLPDGPIPFGAECSGVIAAVGAGVDGLTAGDEVMAVAPFSFGSHVTTPAELVALKPSAITFEEAATIPIAFLTAAYALEDLGRLGAGERVLIHSASGGVGLAALQLARRAGADVFATAGTPEKRAYLENLGVPHVMDSRSLAFADQVMAVTEGRGVDLILNSLAGEAIPRGLAILADHGRFLEIGKRDIYQNARVGLAPFRRNLSLFAIDLDRMMRERPAVLGALLRRLAEEVGKCTLSPLPHQVVPVSEITTAFRAMQQGKHIGKIVVSMRERPSAIAPGDDEPLRLREDATYLITGGWGGFGLAIARWMAKFGARHLVLLSRQGPQTPEAHRVLSELEAAGIQVAVPRADVASATELAAVLAEIDRTMPALRGVVHAAMVLEDSTLLNLDRDRLRRVLAPKTSGAWNLHLQTLGRDLDHFILFSSLSSVLGHSGQGNYAAANAFLDALAHYRRALGLPGLTLNWGALAEVGYIARRRALSDRLERQGIIGIPTRQALAMLERAIQRDAIQLGVMRIDWSRWSRAGLTGAVSPRIAHLVPRAEDSERESWGGSSVLEAILSVPPDRRSEVLEAHIRDKVGRVLGTVPETIDREKTLLNLGLDSLMAVELRNWIEGELHVNLPIVELMRSPGLVSLTGVLLERITSREADATPAVDAAGFTVALETPAREAPPTLFPLAYGQRGLWLLHQLDPTGAACNLAFPFGLRSRLDVDAFRQTLRAIIERHPILRTTFEGAGGDLRQRVHDNVTADLELIDASAFSDEELRDRVEAEAHRPFDLECGPLFRMQLFTRSPEEHVYLLALHHLVGDYWSLVLVLEEFRAIYQARRQGTHAVLPPPSGHYCDFVRWQRDLLDGPEGERLWSFWKSQLADVAPILDLPTDRPRPPLFSHRGGALASRISAEVARGVKALAAEAQVTPYSVLLAAFQVLLGRTSGQDDFVVGSPFAGRSRPEFEGIVGDFINMLPLRADLSGDPTFRAYLRRTSATVLDALQHQDYPFPLIVEGLDIQRDPARTPLVQATFTLERAQRASEAGTMLLFLAPSDERRDVGGLPTIPFSIEQRTCQTDLELVVEEGGGTIDGAFRYNADLFDRATIERMAGHWQTLVAGLVADPDRPLSELPWLTDGERREIVEVWSRGAVEATPLGLCLHHLVYQQVARTPDAVAVSAGERSIRYGELDAWAGRIAARLRRAGARRGSLVALYLPRAPETVAAMLGTLKAGAAFVPLDPDEPAERLHIILDETRAAAILTLGPLAGRLPRSGAEVIALDEMESRSEDLAARNAEGCDAETARPEDLAYVIFTSGSTGRPKGVMIEHRAILNTVLWRRRALEVGPDDRVLLATSCVFDPSVCLTMSSLAAGAELVLADPGEERDPGSLLARVARHGVTAFQLLPTVLQLMLDGPFTECCRAVRWVACGGEPMPPGLPGRLFEVVDVDLHNLYGPTEAAVEATWWTCQPCDPRPVVPIGRPITNMRTYVMDRHGRPQPVGVAGELYIGGAGLARGYLNDPALTAERFIQDPFGDRPGARLFRTGDRCRWLADGSLEFLGRLDQQVKLRGYRIELGEIEAALGSFPEIREAAATLHAAESGDQKIAAYVVPRDAGAPPAVEALREHLRTRLPGYMVPDAVVTLAALPRTPTGKVDRAALPVPSALPRQSGRRPEPPRTPLEEFLVELWEEVLGQKEVGVHDNFFELGGSSIQGAILVNLLQQKLGQRVSTIALFDAPTVAGLAGHLGLTYAEVVRDLFRPESLPSISAGTNGAVARIDQARDLSRLVVPLHASGTPYSGEPAGLPNGESTRSLNAELSRSPNGEPARSSEPASAPLFLVHPPGGIISCYQALANHLGDDQPLYAIRARGLYGEEEPPSRLETMARDYVEAIREVQPQGPYHLGGWSLGGVVALEMAQQLMADGEDIGLLAFLDTTIPFGPANRRYTEGLDESGREYGLEMTLDELGDFDADAQLPYLWQHVQKLGLIEAEIPLPLVQKLLEDLKRLFHAHVRLASEYAVRPYPGRITLFRPTDSPVEVPTPEDRGWGRLAADVEIRHVPGQHHTMIKEPYVQTLAQHLRRCLRPRAAGPISVR